MKIIQLENVSKKFIIKYYDEGQFMNSFRSFSEKSFIKEYYALQNINMSVDRGMIVGIIGRNGAGKTTLLNILAGISTPSEGRVIIDGKVSSMLTLGAGFKNELSGRENIYLNGLVLGMIKKEISKKIKYISEFSELNGFLNAPLQTYSQGMILRLGFSIAIHVEFDILLVDEVIVVGDVSFQKKCFEAMHNFKKQGKSMIFSTQSMEYIERMCDIVYVLENGKIEFCGKPYEAILYYQRLLNERKLTKNI